MSYNYNGGETDPRLVACALAQTVEVGDLVAIDTAVLEKASDTTWDTDLATTQEAFHDMFFGVAGQRSRAVDSADIRCATKGRFTFTCAAATFALGALVGPAKAAGNALEDGKVAAVANADLAIGRVSKVYGSNTTTVVVEILSTLAHAGPQEIA